MSRLNVNVGDTLFVKEVPYRHGGEPRFSEVTVEKVARLYVHAFNPNHPSFKYKFRIDDGCRVDSFPSARAWATAAERDHDAVMIEKRAAGYRALHNPRLERLSEADLDALIAILESAA